MTYLASAALRSTGRLADVVAQLVLVDEAAAGPDSKGALIGHRLEASDDAEPSYWREGLLDEVAAAGRKASAPLLLPGFDEFILGYADRTFAMTPGQHAKVVPGN